MKLTTTLSAFGLLAVAVTSLAAAPAPGATAPGAPVAESITGKFALQKGIDQFRSLAVEGSLLASRVHSNAQQAEASSSTFTLPAPGASGSIVDSSGACVVPGATADGYLTRTVCSDDIDQSWHWVTNPQYAAYDTLKFGAGESGYLGVIGTRPVAGPASGALAVVGSSVPGSSAVVETPEWGSSVTDTRPVFSGQGRAGAHVTVDGYGERYVDTTVAEDGTWSQRALVAFEDSRPEGVTVFVTQTVNGAIQVPIAHRFDVNRAIVKPALVTPAEGAVVSEARPVFSGTGESGATISIDIDSQQYLSTEVVDGMWSITPQANLAVGAHSGTVTQSLNNRLPDVISFTFTREASAVPSELVVAAPAVGGTITAPPSGWIRPVFSGTATPGATVQVRGPWGDVFGSVLADATTGAWSLRWDFNVQPNYYVGGATVELIDGDEVGREGYDFTVIPAIVDSLKVANPTQGGAFTTNVHGWVRPVFSGTATPGATVRVQGPWGNVFGSTTADATTGEWNLPWDFDLSANHYVDGATVELVDGIELDRDVYDFWVVQPSTLTVENPTVGGTFTTDTSGWVRPMFSGTATPGATVQVQGPWGNVFGSTTADATTGAWSLEWSFHLQPNRYVDGVTVELVDGVEVDRTRYDFWVVAPE